MNFAILLTYLIFGIIFYLAFNNPKLSLLLLLATQFMHIYNFVGIPRVFSPIMFELIIMLIIFYKFSKFINLRTIIRSSRIFFYFCFLHMFIIVIQMMVYSDVSFAKTTQSIFAIYLKLFVLYCIVIGFLAAKGNFSSIIKALLVNLFFLFGFIYLEYFTGISHESIFKTVLHDTYGNTLDVSRHSYKLIPGPFSQWVATGSVLSTYLAVIIFHKKQSLFQREILLLFLFFTILLVGARAPVLAALIILLFDIIMKHKLKAVMYLVFILLLLPLLMSTFEKLLVYYVESFNLFSKVGVNLLSRLEFTTTLFSHLFEVPLLGYAWNFRMDTANLMPVNQHMMEVNLFLRESYSYGLPIAFLTTYMFMTILVGNINGQSRYNHAVFCAWLAILICGLSNGMMLYQLYVVPVIFLGYVHWENLAKKFRAYSYLH